MVMEVLQEDMGDGSMQCTDHPYKNSTPGGICAFCLQEKLGKLVSSSFPVAISPSSSSSPSPSFRSEFNGGINPSSAPAVRHNASSSSANSHHIVSFNHGSNGMNGCEYGSQYYYRKYKMPFLLNQRRKKKKKEEVSSIVFKRSKSTATPRRGRMDFLDADEVEVDDYSPHKKGFWSFLYLSKNSASKKIDFSYPSSVSSASGIGNGIGNANGNGISGNANSMRSRDKKKEELLVVDENESPNQAELDRKVSRSRSVGCGSRSFSGDFLERISTGFGDCTLRRVESQREGGKQPKAPPPSMHRNSTAGQQDCIKERVKCGGIFSGFMIASSSSSSSSSSYCVSSSHEDNVNGKSPGSVRNLAHGRSKSWGWALASPMRAFGSKPSSNGKREAAPSKNTTPNLSAIPSLLTVGG